MFKNIVFKKTISIFITLNLILSQILFAAPVGKIEKKQDDLFNSIIVDNDKNPHLNISQTKNGISLININSPNNKGVSHNIYKKYNVDKNGLILNNSNKNTISKLAGNIDKNPNFNKNEANLIINEISGNEISNLLGQTEIAGSKADIIISNPNGIYINSAGFLNTNNIRLTTTAPLEQTANSGKIEISGLGLDLSNINKSELITNIAKLNAPIYNAHELKIILGSKEDALNQNTQTLNTNTQYSLDANHLGSIHANKIKIISNKKGVGVKSNSQIITNTGDLIINSQGNIELKNAHVNKNINLNAKEDIILQGTKTLQISSNSQNQNFITSPNKKITQLNESLNIQTKIQKNQIKANNINLKANEINIKNADLDAINKINLKAKIISHKSDKEISYDYDKTTKTKLLNENTNLDFKFTNFNQTINKNEYYNEKLIASNVKSKKINYKADEINLQDINLPKNANLKSKNINKSQINLKNSQILNSQKIKFDLNSGEYFNSNQTNTELTKTKELLQIYKNNANIINDLINPNLNISNKQDSLNNLSNLLLTQNNYNPNNAKSNLQSLKVTLLNTTELGSSNLAFKGNFNQENPNNIYLNLANLQNQDDLIYTLAHELSHVSDNTNSKFIPNSKKNEITANVYANLNSNAFNIISNLKTGENSNNLELNYDNSNLINLKILNENNKEFSNLDKTKGSDLAPLAIPASLLIGITVKFTTEVVKKGLIKYGGKYFTNRLLNENEEVYILQRDEAEDLIDELGSSSKIDIDDLDKYELQESDGDLSDTQINNNSNSAITTSPNPKKDDDKDKNDKKNDENNINKILSNSKRLPNTSTKLQQFEKSGGYKQAQKDFETLKLKNITTSKSSDGSLVKIGELSDGTKVNIRTKSSYGSSATLEIQDKNPIKIRYN